jgi:hypothetical protein
LPTAKKRPREKAGEDICTAKKWFGQKDGSPCKVCNACKKDDKDKCALYPYNSDCCKRQGKTGHHVIPKRCMMKDGKSFIKKKNGEKIKYNKDHAPCICVKGAARTDEHGEVHISFDFAEALAAQTTQSTPNPNTWTYSEASEMAAWSVHDKFPECSEACVKAQLDAYHKDELGIEDDTLLRADPLGKQPLAQVFSNMQPTQGAP